MKKIIFDTDPGVDDAIALYVACQHPALEVVGVTTVFGNATTDITTRNAHLLLNRYGKPHIPVFAGASKPLIKTDMNIADFVHGKDGLGNTVAPDKTPATNSNKKHAAQWIIDTCRQSPGEISIVAIAPLTNLALALQMEPELANWVKEVIIMGGVINQSGNVSPAAEANIYNDPHSADIVFSAKWPMTLLGLDVTEKLHLPDSAIASLINHPNPVARYFHEITRVYRDFYHTTRGVKGIYIHDLAAVAYAIDPSYFECRLGQIRVVTEGIATGMTIMNRRLNWSMQHDWSHNRPVNVALDVAGEKAMALFYDCLENTHHHD